MKRIWSVLLFTLITLSLTAMSLYAETEQDSSPSDLSDGAYHLDCAQPA